MAGVWQLCYYGLVCYRILSVLSPQYGYIHPDEFFQGPEIIAGDVFNYDVYRAWEFDRNFPIRSPFLWYILCGYIFTLMKMLKMAGFIEVISPYWILILPRLVMTLLSLLTEAAVMRICAHLRCQPYMAGCICASSYVTIVYYTRTFSNSLEALFLALLLLAVIEFSKIRDSKLVVIRNRVHTSLSAMRASSPSAIIKHEHLARSQKCDKEENSVLHEPVTHDTTMSAEPILRVHAVEPFTEEAPSAESVGKSSKQNELHDASKSADALTQPEDTDSNEVEGDKKESHLMHTTDSAGETEDSFTERSAVEESTCLAPNGKSRLQQIMELHTMATSSAPAPPIQADENQIWKAEHRLSLVITAILVVGVWNRPTFLGFALIPTLYWLFEGSFPVSVKDIVRAIGRGAMCLPYVMNGALILVLFDTSYYRLGYSGSTLHSLFSDMVITPLNFIVYNQNSKNLQEHGLHPFYLHIVANLPILFGPLMAFVLLAFYFIIGVQNASHKKIVLLMLSTVCVSVALLSMFPHQEARFLIALLGPCVVVTTFMLKLVGQRLVCCLFFIFWILQNVVIGVMFGMFHQAGVVPSLLFFNALKSAGQFNNGATIIYHRTYMPPRHLLQLHIWEARNVKVIDLQGHMSDEGISAELAKSGNAYFVTPYAEQDLTPLLGEGFSVRRVMSFYPHFSGEDPPDLAEIIRTDRRGKLDWVASSEAIHRLLRLNIYYIVYNAVIVQAYPQTVVAESVHSGSYERLSITLPKHVSKMQ